MELILPEKKLNLTQLRIGHTRLTHGHSMNKEEKIICASCEVALTVKHLLIKCRQTKTVKNICNIPKFLSQSLGQDETAIKNMTSFLKEINIENILY